MRKHLVRQVIMPHMFLNAEIVYCRVEVKCAGKANGIRAASEKNKGATFTLWLPIDA